MIARQENYKVALEAKHLGKIQENEKGKQQQQKL